jgi:hypothetical protein
LKKPPILKTLFEVYAVGARYRDRKMWHDASLRGMNVTAQLIHRKRKPPKIFLPPLNDVLFVLFIKHSQVSFQQSLYQTMVLSILTYTISKLS